MSKTITYNFTDENFDIIYNAFVRQVPMRQILVDGELVDEYSSPEEHLREFAIKAVMKKCNKGW